jgi:hypothetical protein
MRKEEAYLRFALFIAAGLLTVPDCGLYDLLGVVIALIYLITIRPPTALTPSVVAALASDLCGVAGPLPEAFVLFLLSQSRTSIMTQVRLNRAVARATGESLATIARMGFVPLTQGPVEREPHVVNWDKLDGERIGLFPPLRKQRSAVA